MALKAFIHHEGKQKLIFLYTDFDNRVCKKETKFYVS